MTRTLILIFYLTITLFPQVQADGDGGLAGGDELTSTSGRSNPGWWVRRSLENYRTGLNSALSAERISAIRGLGTIGLRNGPLIGDVNLYIELGKVLEDVQPLVRAEAIIAISDVLRWESRFSEAGDFVRGRLAADMSPQVNIKLLAYLRKQGDVSALEELARYLAEENGIAASAIEEALAVIAADPENGRVVEQVQRLTRHAHPSVRSTAESLFYDIRLRLLTEGWRESRVADAMGALYNDSLLSRIRRRLQRPVERERLLGRIGGLRHREATAALLRIATLDPDLSVLAIEFLIRRHDLTRMQLSDVRQWLLSGTPAIQLAAVNAACEIVDPEVVGLLVDALHEPGAHLSVQHRILEVLGEVGSLNSSLALEALYEYGLSDHETLRRVSSLALFTLDPTEMLPEGNPEPGLVELCRGFQVELFQLRGGSVEEEIYFMLQRRFQEIQLPEAIKQTLVARSVAMASWFRLLRENPRTLPHVGETIMWLARSVR